MSRLLGDRTKHAHRQFGCRRCLHQFSSKERLLNHSVLCDTHKPQKICMPEEDEKFMSFRSFEHQMWVPFVIYADLECFLAPISTCVPDPSKSSTTNIHQHIPSGFSYVVVDAGGKCVAPPTVYRGENVVDVFFQHMLEWEERISAELANTVPLKMTAEAEVAFQAAISCSICSKPLGTNRVRDHCHVTGTFRGAAHSSCNLNYQVAEHIPVYFHNLKHYDSHILMAGLGKIESSPITVIPRNMEQYVSFSLGKLRFLDSFQMMPSSLQTLTANLANAGTENFKVLKQCISEDKIPLLVRKGVYPYEYMDGPARLEETSLPPKDVFFSTLTEEGISDRDYEHAQNVWNAFQIESLGDYHDLYVKSDVLLLADVFQSFRQICMSVYRLDAAHFYTAPGLAWEACLKHTGVNLELITDLDQYLFIEEGIRGGIAMISTRYSKANNKYLPDYNPELPSQYIGYYDANNLYGWAMSLPLPVDQFRWMSPNDIDHFNVQSVPEDSDTGYILSVDLEYPTELHQSHNDYPLAPEKRIINPSMLSTYSLELNNTLNIKTKESTTKLVPNLNNKKNYIIHYRNLQFYLKLGLKLTCIHKVLQFRQSAWLKSYIELNTERRTKAVNDFEKDFYKLMNNAVFGKSMEDVRKRISIALIKTAKRLKRYAASPAFQSFKIFNENLVGVHMLKAFVKLNRPIQTGFTILDNSKMLMYDFHYNYMRETYQNKAKLLFTDTDSLCYQIETEDLYEDNFKDRQLFDTSDYPKDHFLFSNENKKVIGKMKDELAGVPVEEFIGLRPKMYSIKSAKGEKKIAKGIVKSTVRKHIRHQHYKECLFNQTNQSVPMTRIASNVHILITVNIRKLGLSATDDKRYILADGINTLVHGHCDIVQSL